MGERGVVEVRYPPSFSREDAERIAEHYAGFFPVAEELLGDAGYAEAIVYVIPVAKIPESYKFHIVRKGKKWVPRHLATLLWPPDRDFDSHDYWRQVGTDMHELAHIYLLSLRSGCFDSPGLRWLEEGIGHLVQAIYLKQHRPEAFKEWVGKAVPTDMTAFNGAVFWWPEKETEEYLKLDKADIVRETDKYAVAYHLVRYIYESESGRSLRALDAALRAKNPSRQEDVEAILKEVLAIEPQSLLSKARERTQEPEVGRENER